MKRGIISLLLACMLLFTGSLAAMAEAPMEASILLKEDAAAISTDMLYFKLIKEKFGLDLTPVAVNVSNYAEKLNLLLATRELPDIVNITGTAEAAAQTLLNQYGPEGAFVPLNEYLDRLPNVVKWIEEYDEDNQVWERITAVDGNIYGLPTFQIAVGSGNFFSVRSDIMEKHDLQTPTTWDELTELLRELKSLYPDFPGLTKPDGTIFERAAPMFGTRHSVYYDYDLQRYEDGRRSENFKDMLLWFQNLYNEGLLDPDSFTMTREIFESGILNGKYLMYIGYVTWGDNLSVLAQQNEPGFQFMYFTHPEYDGKVQPIVGSKIANEEIVWCLPTSSDKLDIGLDFLNWLYSDEGIMVSCYGEEGVTYFYDEEGTARFMPEYSTARNTEGTLSYNDEGIRCHTWYGVLPFQIDFFGPSNEAAYTYSLEHDLYQPQQPPFRWLDELDQEDYTVILAQIDTLLNEAMTQFVVGNQPMSAWEDALAKAEAVGWQKALDLRQANFEAMNAE